MKRLFLSALLFLGCYVPTLSQRNSGTWDRQMQLIQCNIKIKADAFTASTFIEMEFYNPGKEELEGLYNFQLAPGQIVTAFQLDLHGQYRDGSIEEKWKATNAYNTIVGKRIDPALLTMDYDNHYSLRIYPVPAKGSRKITMTIQQPMAYANGYVNYSLPLDVRQKVPKFHLDINVSSNESPVCRDGLIRGHLFAGSYSPHELVWKPADVMLDKPLQFSIPVSLQQPEICTRREWDKTYFALRFKPDISKEYSVQPKNVTVFWDISASQQYRDIRKEMNFLKQYIAYHGVQQLRIITFNYRTQDTAIFRNIQVNNKSWQRFLEEQSYDGGTQLASIDLSTVRADAVLLFTEGLNTYGHNTPKPGNVLVHAVHASSVANEPHLESVVKGSGGSIINLNKASMSDAVAIACKAKNTLVDIRSSNGKTVVDVHPGTDITQPMLVSGTMAHAGDTLSFVFGNNNTTSKIEKVFIGGAQACKGVAIERMHMFGEFEKIHKGHDWSALIDFGLKEKVVTRQTAYIVLERVEDYVKYNITPPAELEEACKKMNYVKKDTRFQREWWQRQSEADKLTAVANVYNTRLKWYDKEAEAITLNAGDVAMIKDFSSGNRGFLASNIAAVNNSSPVTQALEGKASGVMADASLDEVVVSVPYGTTQKKSSYSGSHSVVSWRQLQYYTNLRDGLVGRVPGLYVTNDPGNAGIVLRGMSSVTKNNSPLVVVDGVPSDVPLDQLSTFDVDHVTILKDATATAIYGSRGSAGVIVIATKKGKVQAGRYNEWLRYKLKNQEDIQYMQEIKAVSGRDKYERYMELRSEEKREAGFYFDMAQHLHEHGYGDEAVTVLSNAAEAASGDVRVQRAMAFMLERWGRYDEAIVIYGSLVKQLQHDLELSRDLAWAYYQQGDPQAAVNILYKAITNTETGNNYYYDYYSAYKKAALLEEMNGIIAIHKEELDISFIPAALVRPMPVDLKIVVQNNNSQVGNILITEPDGSEAGWSNQLTKNGGAMNYAYYYNSHRDYSVKQAMKGTYRITATHYDYGNSGKYPSFIRLIVFRNFGRKKQQISVENIIMDYQSGDIEIGEVKW